VSALSVCVAMMLVLLLCGWYSDNCKNAAFIWDSEFIQDLAFITTWTSNPGIC